MDNWKSNLTDLVPYEAGEQLEEKGVIKLNSNENPYPPSPAIEKALKNFKYEQLNKYPKRSKSALDIAISGYYNVSPENVFCGNSSDEVLAMCFKAFFNSEKPILFPDITYSFYPVWCRFYDIDYNVVPLNQSFAIRTDDYKAENGGIIIPNPNAPTGIELHKDWVEQIVKNNQNSIVVIDEAYADFADSSAVELTGKYENLLVVRTTSKSRSLAGLRVGYAIGSEILIRTLNAAMNSFNAYPISTLSMEVAKASFEDNNYFTNIIDKIKKTRQRTSDALKERGFILTNSKTNFLFIKHDKINAEQLYKYLLGHKILVRHFGGEKLNNYLRVSIGTDEEMAEFLKQVDEYMEANNAI